MWPSSFFPYARLPTLSQPRQCCQNRLPTLSQPSVSLEAFADAGLTVSVGGGVCRRWGGCQCRWRQGRPGFGRWCVGDVGELSGFPGLRLFSRIRRGSLRESGVLADIVPTGTLEIRGS